MKNAVFELTRIVQTAALAASREEQVQSIVKEIAGTMHAAVCSLYLVDDDGDLVLVATEGLDRDAVGHVRLPLGEGLVGRVARTRRPVNIADAASDPDFRYFPETHEERFNGFCAVPLVHLRKVTGVLVTQQRARRAFSAGKVAFLITLAAHLSLLVADGTMATPEDVTPGEVRMTRHKGVKGAPGVAIGRVLLLDRSGFDQVGAQSVGDVEPEIEHWRELVARTRDQIDRELGSLPDDLADDVAGIFSVYRMFLDDAALHQEVETRIRAGNWLPGALREAIRHLSRPFDAMEDAYLKTRKEDIRHLGEKLYANWRGTEALAPREGPMVLAGDAISVADIGRYCSDGLVGLVSFSGSKLSHVAVLAGALGIPAVMGTGPLKAIRYGQEIIVDGHRGQIILDPTAPVRDEFSVMAEGARQLDQDLEKLRDEISETADGKRIKLYTNTGLLSDITPGLMAGAEGVGLYRTEIPFMLRETFPSEEEQLEVYRHVLLAYRGKPVYMRTLDIGGDKALPYYSFPEDNPYLGWRGIRFTLDDSALLMTQVRAMVRAAEGLDNLHILLPMVSRTDELQAFRELLDNACEQLELEDVRVSRPKVGIMVEVPAAAVQLKFWQNRIDFVSIGSNDLSQYLLAVDRNNPRVSGLFDHVHPAVLHTVNQIVGDARRLGMPVGICGEMASDPIAVILLLGMGIETLSMNARNIARVKWIVRSVTYARAQALLAEALTLENETDIRTLVGREIDAVGLGVLID